MAAPKKSTPAKKSLPPKPLFRKAPPASEAPLAPAQKPLTYTPRGRYKKAGKAK